LKEAQNNPVVETKVTVTASPRRKPGPRRRAAPSSISNLGVDIASGDRIDRYVVLEAIGAGGMGVVFKATDPDLDRQVAIKLLRPGSGSDSPEGRARLVREGQAIARLAHPNVVAVHDIGVFRDDLCFVAMGYVEGRSLRQWLEVAPRPPRQIVEVFVQAGKGLAAAHAKGIIHRDFKPDNVLVGDDGRVRVADFGLARSEHDSELRGDGDDSRGGDELGVATPGLGSPLTHPGRVMGTPAFMAPEQHRGERGDARSDQFAFCVALYQALCGTHPFRRLPRPLDGDRPLDDPRPTPPEAKVPGWLDRLLRHGLATDPAARFPSMDALLAELQRDRGRARRTALIGGAVLGSVALGVAITMLSTATPEPRKCRGADAMFDAVWNDAARQRVRAAFVATERPYAAASFARIDGVFDGYGAAWTSMSTSSCEATQVHGVQSEQVLDLRTACLDRRLSELRALITVLATEPDPTQVDQAVQAAYGLTSLASCADTAALAALVPPPTDPQVRQRVDELRGELDRASALQSTAAYAEALTIAEAVAAASDRIDHAPLRGEAYLRLGAIQQKNGAPKLAEASLHRALQAAAAAMDTMQVARILSELVWVVGYQQARYDEGDAYFQSASAATSLAGDDVILHAQLLKNAGTMRFDQGEYDAARRYYEEASAALELAFGSDHPYVATALNNVGSVLLAQGEADRALPYFQRALAIAEQTLGAEHPNVTDYLNNIGAVLGDQGKVAESRAYYLRALATLEKTLGPDHLDLGYPLFNIGVGYTNEDRGADAVPYYQRALAIREAALGPDHPHVAYPLTGLGQCRLQLGQPDEASALFERAARILEASETDPNPLAGAHFDLAQALWAAGKDRPRALALATAARRTWADSPRWAEELAEVEAWLREHPRCPGPLCAIARLTIPCSRGSRRWRVVRPRKGSTPCGPTSSGATSSRSTKPFLVRGPAIARAPSAPWACSLA
jgi:tetratricopeptide (TPR) repeat protein